MGNFSRDTFDRLKHYVSCRLQQGVPIVDADWNEVQDIRKHELETFLKWFVGNGVPLGNDGFAIGAGDRITGELVVDGNVGIGTTNPGAPLQIPFQYNTPNGGLRLREGDGLDYWDIRNISHGIGFDYLGTTKLVLQYAGNVGIGTAYPKATLDVKGNGSFASHVNLWSDGERDWQVGHIGGINAHDFGIADEVNNTGPARMVIRRGHGYVGIGTSQPVKHLHVKGRSSARAASQDSYGSTVIFNDANDRPGVVIEGDFPSLELFSGANNTSFGPTLRLGGHNDDTKTTWKHWVIGTAARNAYWLDFGFCANKRDPHSGIRNAYGGKTVMTLYQDGRVWAETRTGGGVDYAEYFEASDGSEIPAGTSVVLEADKIRSARKGEVPIGVISANPGIVGGVHIEWPKKYLRDALGNQIMEEYEEEIMVPKKEKTIRERQKVQKQPMEEEVTRTEIVLEGGKYLQKEIAETVSREVEEPVFEEVDLYDATGRAVIGKHRVPVMETYEEEIHVLDDDGQPVLEGTGKFETNERPKLNPDYSESNGYVPRTERPEWNCVGLLGKLPLRKGQPVAENWIKMKDLSDEVELWLVK